MCLFFICEEKQKVLSTQTAPGSCPYCGGIVQYKDVESQRRLFFLPLCFKIKRKYFCSSCSKRLEIYP